MNPKLILKCPKFQPVSELDENFVRVIEYEYAVKYLEYLGVEVNLSQFHIFFSQRQRIWPIY
jgi:hypothetical protein